jgi:hypothetical protein
MNICYSNLDKYIHGVFSPLPSFQTEHNRTLEPELILNKWIIMAVNTSSLVPMNNKDKYSEAIL